MIKRSKSYKRYNKPAYPMSSGQSCICYCKAVLNVNFDALGNISGELDHATNLPNAPEYQNMSSQFRKASILKASCVFMPANQLVNATSALTNLGPVFIAPYHGEYIGNVFSYGRLGLPGCIVSNPCDPSRQRRAYWYKKPDMEDFETAAGAPAGRILDASYGGFLLFADGTGWTQGTQAGHLIITFKVLFKDRKVLA